MPTKLPFRKRLSGKRPVRENDHPGNVFPGNVSSGKEKLSGKRLVQEKTIWETKPKCILKRLAILGRGRYEKNGREFYSISGSNLISCNFYRAMHFSAKRGIAIACRLSVRPSVRPSVCDVGEL